MRAARVTAMIFLAAVMLAALAPELWAPAHYQTQFRDAPDAPPSARFPLGTDDLGRDRFTRLLYGTRVSLLLAPAAALLSCLGAAVLGGAAGLAGGLLETVILGAADLFLSLPWLFLLLTVRACLPLNVSPAASVTLTFVLLGTLGWATPARIIRAAVARLKHSEFMLHARASGCPPWRLLWAHLRPNVMPVLLAQFWVAVPVYILAEATLGMLGLGVVEPLPSLGGILRELENGGGILSQPWLLSPAVLLAAVVGSFQLVLPREDYSV
ncbi:MAG: ABC transporter permease subunit [Bryobacteraceae bacterium]|jgi:ABC-type dipeptide/oligopeptide/nickel transport system permease subunit